MAPEHFLIVHQGKGDDFPWVSIQCGWGPRPDRPCRAINCPVCFEEACDECLTEHGAVIDPGCGVREWLEATGTTGVAVHGLKMAVLVDVAFDDGWVLTVRDDG